MVLIERKHRRIYIDAKAPRPAREYSRTLVFPETPTIYAEVAMTLLGSNPGWPEHVWAAGGGIIQVTKANGEVTDFPTMQSIVRVSNATAVTFLFRAINAQVMFHYSVSRWEPTSPVPNG